MAPALTTAVGRIRFALGDHDVAESLLDGGEQQYKKLLALLGNDEAATFRAAAGALAAFYAAQPVRVSAGGKTVDYSARVPLWRSQASGASAYPFGADGSATVQRTAPPSGGVTTEVTW